jgi:hypothetical protein
VGAPWHRFEADPPFDEAEARRIAALSPTPGAFAGRTALIYRPAQSAMTSGVSATRWWTVRLNRQNRWRSQLMGWQSSGDTAMQVEGNLRFETEAEAVRWCERAGVAWELSDAGRHTRRGGVDNQYAYTFLSMETSGKMAQAGPRRARHIFAHPDAPSSTGVSTFVNYRYTQRGNESWKPRADGSTHAAGVAQGPTAWTGPEWPAAKPRTDRGGDGHGDGEHH